MSRNVDGETDILLGNKQLLGIFFILAVLFGVSFVAGYMVGNGSFSFKKTTTEAAAQNGVTPTSGSTTRALDPGATDTAAAPAPSVNPSSAADETPARSGKATPDRSAVEEPAEKPAAGKKFAPLPSEDPARAKPQPSHADRSDPDRQPDRVVRRSDVLFTPEPGQRFLQVAAEGREAAEAVADVLNKAGFPAHVTPKPKDDKIFRVLVGPIKDNSDFTAKREALMKKGFREVIPRTY